MSLEFLMTALGAAVTVAVPLAGWVLKIQARLSVSETKVEFMEKQINGIETRILQELRDLKGAVADLMRAMHDKADRDR